MKTSLGTNIDYSIDKGILTITADLNIDNGLTPSGKSHSIATTHGNQKIDDKGTKLSVNIYRKNLKYVKSPEEKAEAQAIKKATADARAKIKAEYATA